MHMLYENPHKLGGKNQCQGTFTIKMQMQKKV